MKFIHRSQNVMFADLKMCLLLFSLICLICEIRSSNFTHEEGELFRMVEELASHNYRHNISNSLHYRINRRLDFFASDNEEPLARRLINTFRPSTMNPTPNQNINRDPLWNSNNRYSNRFEKHSSSNYNNINRRPSFTTYPTFTYATFSPATTHRPGYYNKPAYSRPANSATRPSTAAAGGLYNSSRPFYVRPNFSRPDRYPKYFAECACKRKMNGVILANNTNELPITQPSMYNNTNLRTNAMSSRPTRTRSLSSNDRFIPRMPYDPRIVNGSVANYYQVPWMVSLGKAIDGKYTKDSHFCGATLISPSWVLTAGHCLTDFKPQKIIVAYGSGNRTEMKHFSEVDAVVVHPNYSGWPRYLNDIGLLKLKEPVQLDGSIKPACLLHSNMVRFGKQFDAVGWGRIGVEDEFPISLQKAKFEHVTLNDCKTRWDKELDHPDITKNNICVYNQYSDICGGDSGSALSNMAEDGVSYVVGVASFTNFCDQTQPAVYVQILPYIDWIVAHVKNFC